MVDTRTRHGWHGATEWASCPHRRTFVERARPLAEAEAAALALWKAGIAQALMARRLALVGRRAARDAAVRNDPIGGRGMDGGGSAIGAGSNDPIGGPTVVVMLRCGRRAGCCGTRQCATTL